MAGGQVLHVVGLEYEDFIDSLWTCRDAAEARVEELRKAGQLAYKKTFYANVPEGIVVNLDA